MIKKLVVGGVALATVAAGILVAAGPASAGRKGAVLTVTKTVEGEAPADAEFIINVFCVDVSPPTDEEAVPVEPAGLQDVVYDEDIRFGPEGGSEEFDFFQAALCEITEVQDGGADEVSGEGEVAIEDPTEYEAEIVNTFSDAPTTETTEAPTTTAVAAGAVRAAPTFTG